MTITPNSSVFTALSLNDIAKPLPRAAAQTVQRPGGETGQPAVTRPGDAAEGRSSQRDVNNGAKFRQAVNETKAEAGKEDAAAGQQQVADDFRREAVSPRRPTFQKLGQMVDLSV